MYCLLRFIFNILNFISLKFFYFVSFENLRNHMHNFQSNFIFMMKFITFFNETPLLIAAKLNNLKIVELLLEKKK